ncbi:helix-turn-helix domain-containing protein [Sphingopyxis sp.]|uniref:helix-turn-helix domain-containing protein n=1 Tax=Sphingopyxis sp. TaxID=1908224 RepID=UPI002D78CF4B|nr:helix-turn-helix domain-containing protein [Sphingopyxis sp.]HET6526062.1 helix-turn-helix domain-containing protein [Sphingopyxis sp.]
MSRDTHGTALGAARQPGEAQFDLENMRLLTECADTELMVISAYFQAPDASTGKRRAARRKLLLEVKGAHADSSVTARIHNISLTGMLIESDALLAVADLIDVELPHAGTVTTKLVWASGQLYGCEFETPISPAALAAAQLRGDAASPMTEESDLHSEAAETHGMLDRFGANLKRLRIAKGLSQAAVAAALDVSAPSISGWESGRARPKPDRMTALAALLDVSVAQLIVDIAAEPYDQLMREGRERIARATGASPDKIRIYIEV